MIHLPEFQKDKIEKDNIPMIESEKPISDIGIGKDINYNVSPESFIFPLLTSVSQIHWASRSRIYLLNNNQLDL